MTRPKDNPLFKRWTFQEEEILNDNYEQISIEELCILLPKRTAKSIKSKAFVMGFTGEGKSNIKMIHTTDGTIRTFFDGNLYSQRTYSSKKDRTHLIESIKQRIGISNINRAYFEISPAWDNWNGK